MFTKFNRSMLNKGINAVTSTVDNIGCVLLSNTNNGPAGTTNVQDTAEFVGDVLNSSSTWSGGGGTGPCAEVATGGGYTMGGVSCGGMILTEVPAAHQHQLSAPTNPSWVANTSGFSAYYALFFDSTSGGTLLTMPVICWWDFGGLQNPLNIPFTLGINSSGLINLTTS